MPSLLKMMWLALVFILPGGLLLMVGVVIGRALRHTWELEQGTVGPARLGRALAQVRVRDVWREAGRTLSTQTWR